MYPIRPFKNSYQDHDFSLIYDSIKRYYPIKQAKRLTSEEFAATSGCKKIRELMGEEFFNKGAYHKKWGKFVSALRKSLKKPIAAYPTISGPSLFGEVTLSKIKHDDYVFEKVLNFHISVIGPFYSIQGIDRSTALLPMDSRFGPAQLGNYGAINSATLSPVFEYEDPFNALETALRRRLPGYKFIPYHIGMSTIKNISRPDDSFGLAAMDTIYEGLFGSTAVYHAQVRGDERHGMTDWLKPLSYKEKKLLDSIAKHTTKSTSALTIHKVWKLTDSKPLHDFRRRNVLVGFDPFEVLDFTNKSKVIVSGGKRGSAFIFPYEVHDDLIEISGTFSLRIMDVGRDVLTLRLVLDIQAKQGPVQSEVAEFKFAQMKHQAS